MASADALATLSPDSGHLNHMPGHIYVLCGDYERARVASLKAIRANDLTELERRAANAPGFVPLIERALESALAGTTSVAEIMTSLAGVEDPVERSSLLDDVLTSFAGADIKVTEVFIAGMAKGWKAGRTVVLKDETGKALEKMVTTLPAGSKGQLLRLAANWGNKGLDKYTGDISKTLIGTLNDDKASDTYVDSAGKRLPDHAAVHRSRLQVDTRKWLLSKCLPKIYGDRQHHEVETGEKLTDLIRKSFTGAGV